MNKPKTNIYGRKSTRLKSYNYSQGGYYFVTICTYDRQEWLGKIENGKITVNEYGTVAAIHWVDIPKYYPNVALDDWVIMPNHIHGIIVISSNVGTEQCSVPTKPVSLSQIIKSFKGMVIKQIRSEFGNASFAWQRSFYDHVIRNEESLSRIKEYIRNNPLAWELDIENRINQRIGIIRYYQNIFQA